MKPNIDEGWDPTPEQLVVMWDRTKRDYLAKLAAEPMQRPEFGRLQQVDHRDDYRLAMNGDLVTGLTWADLGKWALVQDEHNRQFPEHALLWEPDHKRSQAERKLAYRQRSTDPRSPDFNAGRNAGEDEWSVIRLELLRDIEHVSSVTELDTTAKALVVLKHWLSRAPKDPAEPGLRWRDKRRGQEACYVFTGDAAVAAIQSAGVEVKRAEVWKLLSEIGAKSAAVHVPAPYGRTMRAYRLYERKLQRLKVPELDDDPDYVPGVEMSEINV
jgi:hypothetical protein